MTRRTMTWAGVLSSVVLGSVTLGAVDLSPASTALPGAGVEVHAPRIPDTGPTPGTRPLTGRSRNWSGYDPTGVGLTSVSGSWNVPQVQTPTKRRQLRMAMYSSSWVGIDGVNNSNLIQAGTEQDWVGGSAFYQAWWEILPAAETPITSMSITPGDAISVSITQGLLNQWTITLTDTTTAQSFSTTRTYTGPGTSAEWIQEAPTVNGRIATLAPDSNVVFDHATANGANPALTISHSVSMFKGRKRISTPSAPNPNRDGFAVAYGSVAPPAPSS